MRNLSGNFFKKHKIRSLDAKIHQNEVAVLAAQTTLYRLYEIRRLREIRDHFEVQSADEGTHEEQQVLEFVDTTMGDQVGSAGVITSAVTDIDTGDYQLSDFLSRPVRIASYDIPQGEAFSQRTLLPWKLFFDSTPIKSKLNNYSYVQCDLKVKFVVNSTPFVYGMYGVSYKPLSDFADHLNISSETDDNIRMCLSQRDTIMLESHKNKGGELTLPFFYYKNWLPLTATDVEGMGKLTIYPYRAFESANGLATNDVSVIVYAWAENVRLAGNTVDLAVQSQDEYKAGPVERTATTISGLVQPLITIPSLAPYAIATSMFADGVAGVASLFGWTNPPVIENVKPFKDQPFHALSSSEISVPAEKLTLDPKNELTVDPRIAGLGPEDSLAILNMAQKPCFIREVTWGQSDIIDFSLFRANVSPTLCRTLGSSPSRRFIDIPAGNLARLFSNWRGDVVIRMYVVRSQYHQGRLRVNFDPTGDIFSTASSESTTNTKIIDIQTDDYVEFRIPYMAPQSWLRVRSSIQRDNSGRGDGDSTYDADYHNGRFEIRVLNPLTGPDTNSDVGLVFYAYMADNYELANPSDVAFKSSTFEVQSTDDPVTPTLFEMGKCTTRPSELLKINFGEDIRSMRQVMRRHTLHCIDNAATRTTGGIAQESGVIIFNIAATLYPPEYGYQTGGPYAMDEIVGVGNAPGLKANITPYTWMSACFVGQRGSMSYAFNNVSSTQFSSINVARYNEPISEFTATNGWFLNEYAAVASPNDVSRRPSGLAGQMLQNEHTQTGVQFHVPFMNKFRFCDTNPANRIDGITADDSENNNFIVEWRTNQDIAIGATVSASLAYESYHAIGTDYNPLYFLNTPVRWEYDADAT